MHEILDGKHAGPRMESTLTCLKLPARLRTFCPDCVTSVTIQSAAHVRSKPFHFGHTTAAAAAFRQQLDKR